jgi:hypothetical protein
VIVFVDGGASFSCVGLDFVKLQGWEHLIQPISEGELDTLFYADKNLQTARRGKIELPVSLHFIDSNRRTLHFTLKFEVVDLPWDFLFGAETINMMFPHSELAQYGADVSEIASAPEDVRYTARDDELIKNVLAENAVNLPDLLSSLYAEFPQPSASGSARSSSSSKSSSSSSSSSTSRNTRSALASLSSLLSSSNTAAHDDAPREQ